MGSLSDWLTNRRREAVTEVVQHAADDKIERPGFTLKNTTAEATLEPGQNLSDIGAILRSRNLNPDDWIVERVTVNEWEMGAIIDGQPITKTLHQLKVFLKANLGAFVLPARTPGPKWKANTRVDRNSVTVNEKVDSEFVAFVPDAHFPYVEQALFDAMLEVYHRAKPSRVVVMGDWLNGGGGWDNHRPDTRRRPGYPMNTEFQEELDTGYAGLVLLRQACPDAEIVFIPGNHEQHYEREILTRFGHIYGVTRPGEEAPLMSVPYLMRLDELGIQYVGAPGGVGSDYPFAYYDVAPTLDGHHGGLFACHGEYVKPIPGMSAYEHMKQHGYRRSVAIGHCHRCGSIAFKNLWAIDTGFIGEKNQGYKSVMFENVNQGFSAVRIEKGNVLPPMHALWQEGELRMNGSW